MENSTTTIQSADLLSDAPENTQEAPSFEIPEAYRDRGWAKGIDSLDSLLNQFDNAQKLIGKKTIGVPSDDAAPEEWTEFYNKMGRPEDPDKYEFEDPSLPENFEIPEDLKRGEQEEKDLKRIFHEAGLTKAQAKAVLKKTDETFYQKYKDQVGEYQAQKQQKDQEFLALVDKQFGDEKPQALAVAETLLKKYVPKGMEDTIRGLDNNTMLALSSVLYNLHKNSKTEGALTKGLEDVQATRSPQELREEARKIMADPNYQNPFNSGRDEMAKRVKDLYNEATRLETRPR